MYSLVAATLLALQVPGTGPTGGDSHLNHEAPRPFSLSPDSVLNIPDGPLVVLKRTPDSPIAALRVSVPRPTTESGAPWQSLGRLLIAQARERTAGPARLAGAQVEVALTPDRIGYQVIGTRFDFETLAWVLRLALAPPEEVSFRKSLERERARQDRLTETPRGVLELRMGASPADQPPSWEEFQAAWARTHQPDSTRVLAMGDLHVPAVVAAFRDIRTVGPRPSRFAAQADRSGASRVHRLLEWRAMWGSLGPSRDAATVIAAEVMRRRLEGMAPSRTTVELVALTEERDLRVGVVATGRSRTDTRTALDAVVLRLEAPLDATEVHAARAEVLAGLHRKLSEPLGWLTETDAHLSNSGGVARSLEEMSDIEPEDVQRALRDFMQSVERFEIGR